MKNAFSKIGASLKETLRKFIVTLKRNPHYIPLAMLLVSFIVLSFNLTKLSNTTATMNRSWMGLCAFASMLLSILSMVCMLNAFPKRQKPKYALVALMFLLFGLIIAADVFYCIQISRGINPANPDAIKITAKNFFIAQANNALIIHIVTVVLTSVCVGLEPVFAKLLRKINTSVYVEDNGEIAEIDISDEE